MLLFSWAILYIYSAYNSHNNNSPMHEKNKDSCSIIAGSVLTFKTTSRVLISVVFGDVYILPGSNKLLCLPCIIIVAVYIIHIAGKGRGLCVACTCRCEPKWLHPIMRNVSLKLPVGTNMSLAWEQNFWHTFCKSSSVARKVYLGLPCYSLHTLYSSLF